MTTAVLTLLLAPVVAAAITAFLRGPARWLVGVLAGAAGTVAALQVAVGTLTTGAQTSVLLRGPFGVEVVMLVDGLGAATLTMAAGVTLGVAGFAAVEDHRAPDRRHRAYWPLVLLLWWEFSVLFLAGRCWPPARQLSSLGSCCCCIGAQRQLTWRSPAPLGSDQAVLGGHLVVRALAAWHRLRHPT